MNLRDLVLHDESVTHLGGHNVHHLTELLRSGLGGSEAFRHSIMNKGEHSWTSVVCDRVATRIECLVAQDPADLAAARALVRKRYARCKYQMPDEDSAPFPDAARASRYLTIIAKSPTALLGTVIMGLDSSAGLLVDAQNKLEADTIRAEGARVCELVRLVLNDAVDTKFVLAMLLQHIYMLCWRVYDVSDILVEVIPRHVPFYCRTLGFVQTAEQKICTRIGGVPVVLLRLNRNELERRLRALARQPVTAAA